MWSGLPAHLVSAGMASERMTSEAAPTVAPVPRLLPGSTMLLGPSVEFIPRSISSMRMIRSWKTCVWRTHPLLIVTPSRSVMRSNSGSLRVSHHTRRPTFVPMPRSQRLIMGVPTLMPISSPASDSVNSPRGKFVEHPSVAGVSLDTVIARPPPNQELSTFERNQLSVSKVVPLNSSRQGWPRC